MRYCYEILNIVHEYDYTTKFNGAPNVTPTFLTTSMGPPGYRYHRRNVHFEVGEDVLILVSAYISKVFFFSLFHQRATDETLTSRDVIFAFSRGG